MNQATLELSTRFFAILRDLVHERTGLYFDESRSEQFIDKVMPLVEGLKSHSLLDYYYALKYADCVTTDGEWGRLMDVLVTPETYFWREMEQIEALVQVMVPEWLERNPFHPLTIWSAGCSTGEEPLTIAMALNEAGWFDLASIRIVAGDASPKAIAAARRGLYRERSFRKLPDRLRDKYFIRRGDHWQVVSEIHRRVTWHLINLRNEKDLLLFTGVPMVFCRNVFLYFSEKAITETVNALYERMSAPGYLFVGVSESLLRLPVRFELEEINSAFVYVKKEQ